MPGMRDYVVGVDFGTLNGRAVVARVGDGAEMGSATHEYRHGVIDERLPVTGRALPDGWALQDPEDYLEVLRHAVRAAVADSGVDPERIVGIAIDCTSCTVLPVHRDGSPLCRSPGLRERPHAYVKLWKHHAAQRQADRITELAHERGEPWIRRYGGRISAEWSMAKALQLLEEDPEVYRQADRWIEAADWLVWQLCGHENRNRCTAGYKAIYQDGRFPSRDYLAALDPRFTDFVIDKVDFPLSALGDRAGALTERAARWTGLPAGIAVAVANVDAHVTAAAANALEPGRMVAIMGTSTCHVMNGPRLVEVAGMCGVVEGGISAGEWGYEAGQSGVGDLFAWCARTAFPEDYWREAAVRRVDPHTYLSGLAAAQPVGAHGLLALDWLNGNRSVLVDHELSGVLIGMTLATRPEDVYRALVEATAFGTRTIVETFQTCGLPVTEFVAAGGLTRNPFVMQVYADVLRRPLSVVGTRHASALGSAIHAAVAAGAYPDVPTASAAMGGRQPAAYQPNPADADSYDQLYAEYTRLHDYFGRGANSVLHRLRTIRKEAIIP